MSLTTLIPLLIKISIMLSVVAIGLKATFSDTSATQFTCYVDQRFWFERWFQ